MSKPKLHIHIGQAKHFLRWEQPFFERSFELVDEPASDAALLVFGPDVLPSGTELPALKRFAYIFPGFACNPLHNLEYRARAVDLIRNHYDAIFINNGPLRLAYKEIADKVVICPFSIDTELVTFKSYRSRLDSLLHVSADYPQKDWPRSLEIMRLTGLTHEIFPPRGVDVHTAGERFQRRANRILRSLRSPWTFPVTTKGYVKHQKLVEKYQAYDGFVHVAAEIPHPIALDGPTPACLLEAGLTGALLFWHDTYGVGKDLDCAFALPLDPCEAARQILEIRSSVDVEAHSRITRQEILDKYDPERAIAIRCRLMLERI